MSSWKKLVVALIITLSAAILTWRASVVNSEQRHEDNRKIAQHDQGPSVTLDPVRGQTDLPAKSASEVAKKNLSMLGALDHKQRVWAERAIPHLDNVIELEPNTGVTIVEEAGDVIVTFYPMNIPNPPAMRGSFTVKVIFDAKSLVLKQLIGAP